MQTGANHSRRGLRELRKAERLVEQGMHAEAIESLHQALAVGADRYTCYLQMARIYQSRQQWDEAVAAAENAIAEHPRKLSAREAVISLYLESRDYARAIDASKALLKLNPRHVPARDALGAAYIGIGDVDAAMRVANDLIRLDPNNANHHFTKALLCQHRGEVTMAVQEFERVMCCSCDEELTVNARRQLETLDALQIGHILTLATEDTVFRTKLLRDSETAVHEKGFRLSEMGRHRLEDIATTTLANLELDTRPHYYH